MLGFISNALQLLNHERAEFLYILFVNRMPQTHFAHPPHEPQSEPVADVGDGIIKFGHRVSTSVTDMFSKCDWVVLKLIKN